MATNKVVRHHLPVEPFLKRTSKGFPGEKNILYRSNIRTMMKMMAMISVMMFMVMVMMMMMKIWSD